MKPLLGTALKRFLRDFKRKNRPEQDLVALLQSIAYPANVGSMFRIADAADMTELILSGITPQPPHPTIDKVGRAKSLRVRWRYEAEATTAIADLRRDGYQIVAVELAAGAVPYYEYDFSAKTCLIVGHEDHGVTKATLAECDGAVFLPMYGRGLSMNVHVALGIVAYHVLHHRAGGASE